MSTSVRGEGNDGGAVPNPGRNLRLLHLPFSFAARMNSISYFNQETEVCKPSLNIRLSRSDKRKREIQKPQVSCGGLKPCARRAGKSMAKIGNRKEPERRLCEFPGLGATPQKGASPRTRYRCIIGLHLKDGGICDAGYGKNHRVSGADEG